MVVKWSPKYPEALLDIAKSSSLTTIKPPLDIIIETSHRRPVYLAGKV